LTCKAGFQGSGIFSEAAIQRNQLERNCLLGRIRAESYLDAPESKSMYEILGEWRIPQGFQEPESEVLFRAQALGKGSLEQAPLMDTLCDG
jgi:hypothetical protein